MIEAYLGGDLPSRRRNAGRREEEGGAGMSSERERVLELNGSACGLRRQHRPARRATSAWPPANVAALLGLNGAGKSVTLKVAGGFVPARAGTVMLDNLDVTRSSPEERVALGVGHVPQGRQLFPALTVEENLRLGAYLLRRRAPELYARPPRGDVHTFPQVAGAPGAACRKPLGR